MAGLAAGATDSSSLKVSIDTSHDGLLNGNLALSLSSYDADLGSLALSGKTVGVAGQVNNYADAAFALNSGAGIFSGSGHSFSIDFGALIKGANLLANLSIFNTATGTADTLGGSFELVGSGFTLSGATHSLELMLAMNKAAYQ